MLLNFVNNLNVNLIYYLTYLTHEKRNNTLGLNCIYLFFKFNNDKNVFNLLS